MSQNGRKTSRKVVPGLFAAALHHHQGGRLIEAEQGYRQVLAIDGSHADSLHLLGVVARGSGRSELAVKLIGRAIAVNGRAAAYHSSLGNALVDEGRLDEAVAACRRSVALAPLAVEGHNNLGGVLVRQGRLAEGAAAYRKALALQPDLAAAHSNLGQALRALGRLDEAVLHCERAIAIAPDFVDARVNLGSALIEQGRLEEAVASLRAAVVLRPDDAAAQVGLGNALFAQERVEEAIDCFTRAIEAQPNYPDGHNNLGNALRRLGRLEAAEALFRRALALRADYVDALINLGGVLRELGRFAAAVACLERVVALRPDWVEGHNGLGNACRGWGRLDEAIGHFRAAVACRPDDAGAQSNLAMALLAHGDYAAGWQAYEWRWMTERMGGHRGFAQPQWRGEAGDGRTLLMHAEQGLGDSLQFCRYATLAAERGWRVVVEAPRALVRLLRGVNGVDCVVETGGVLPHFDVHCPMLSMPLAVGTTVSSIPAAAYLRADAAVWRDRMPASTDVRVGLVWAGNSHACSPELARLDRRRSLRPEQVLPLLDVPGVRFFSLQKDADVPDARLANPMGDVVDFADTAAIVANLDLVVAVDTAVAHLAAALGRPVWLLDRYDPCWRWFLGRRDCPWYPTLRIYRQPQPGDWGSVLAEVAGDLRALAASARRSSTTAEMTGGHWPG